MNAYLDRRAARQAIGARGKESEKKLAKKLGARLTPASGAIDAFKGDFSTADFLIEAKSTTAYSLGVKLEWLVKINAEAKGQGKYPALTISFTHDNALPVKNGEWVCIPLSLFKKLTEPRDE